MQGTFEILAPRAHAKGVELAVYISPDVPRGLLGDPGRLRQVLINLVGNGVIYRARACTTASRSRVGPRRPDVMLNIEVQDSGIGIAATDIPKLFVEFGQIDSSVSRRFGGTGLGLAIARRSLRGWGAPSA